MATGIDRIVDTILSDARAEAEEIAAAGRTRADGYRAAQQAELEKARAQMQREADEALSTSVRRIESSARMDMKNAALARRMEQIDEAFALAGERLKNLSDAEYAAYLERMALENAAGGEQIVISASDTRFTGALMERINARLAQAGRAPLSLAGQSDAFHGGFILMQGGMEVNCTFDAALRFYREALLKEVADILFAAGG